MNQIPNIEETQKTRDKFDEIVLDFNQKFYYEHQQRGLTRLRDDVVGWLRATLHHQLQKAREEGYNAGLADGTGKPLLAVEQMLQKAREEWLREEIKHLQILKRTPQDCEKCHACELAMSCTTAESDRYLNQCLQTIIDRYQSELDQDKKSH